MDIKTGNIPISPRAVVDDVTWMEECQFSKGGEPIPNLFNAAVALRNAPELRDILAYDEMTREAVLLKDPPKKGVEQEPEDPNAPPDPFYVRAVTDEDITYFQEFMQFCGVRRVGRDTVQQAVEMRASENKRHPVREYLLDLQWDGNLRLHGWLNVYLGAEQNEYTAAIGQMFLIAMVARIMWPGCQADYMLVLEGPQGLGKSSACATLAGGWFSNNLPDIGGPDSVRLSMHLRGKWLIEVAELASFNAAEVETLKGFISTQEERYTPKYGRREVHEPRQCVFIGTTNETAYLNDPTGARRFWPVVCTAIDRDKLAADRDQLFAEAVALYLAKMPWWPENGFEERLIKPQQDARYREDPWTDAVMQWIGERRAVSIREIIAGVLQMVEAQITPPIAKRIANILRARGWVEKRQVLGEKKLRLWILP